MTKQHPLDALQAILDSRFNNAYERYHSVQDWYKTLHASDRATIDRHVMTGLRDPDPPFDKSRWILLSGYLNLGEAFPTLIDMLETKTAHPAVIYCAIHQADISGDQRSRLIHILEDTIRNPLETLEHRAALVELAYRDFTTSVPYIQAHLDETTDMPGNSIIRIILQDRLEEVGYPRLYHDCVELAGRCRRRLDKILAGLEWDDLFLADNHDAAQANDLKAALERFSV